MSLENCWNTVLLNWSWDNVVGKINILHHDRVNTGILELAGGHDADIAFLDDFNLGNAKE
jgi:hypothetical protein